MKNVVIRKRAGVLTYHWYDNSIWAYVGDNKEEFLEHPDVQKALLNGAYLYRCITHNYYIVGDITLGCLQYMGARPTCQLEVGPVD